MSDNRRLSQAERDLLRSPKGIAQTVYDAAGKLVDATTVKELRDAMAALERTVDLMRRTPFPAIERLKPGEPDTRD